MILLDRYRHVWLYYQTDLKALIKKHVNQFKHGNNINDFMCILNYLSCMNPKVNIKLVSSLENPSAISEMALEKLRWFRLWYILCWHGFQKLIVEAERVGKQ